MKHFNPYLVDFVLLTAIACGYIAVFLSGAVILARLAIGVRDFLNRNDR